MFRIFTLWTICGAEAVGKEGRSKRSSVRISVIMMAHVPNAGMGSVKRKHRRLLETNTLSLGRNHMHQQTNNAKTHILIQQIGAGKLPNASAPPIWMWRNYFLPTRKILAFGSCAQNYKASFGISQALWRFQPEIWRWAVNVLIYSL